MNALKELWHVFRERLFRKNSTTSMLKTCTTHPVCSPRMCTVYEYLHFYFVSMCDNPYISDVILLRNMSLVKQVHLINSDKALRIIIPSIQVFLFVFAGFHLRLI